MTTRWLAVTVVVAVVAAAGLVVWDAIGPWTSAQWSSSAGWVTVFLAYGAGIVALTQLREAQSLRREQAQPYVAVFMDPLVEVDAKFVELVVKNFGATAAFNVRIDGVPKLERATSEGTQAVPLPVLPTLVPGQEWRALWDFFPRRSDAGLPDKHAVSVTFEDSRSKQFELQYTLDWGINRDRLSVRTYGVHHGVKALQDISKKLGE